MASLEDTDKTWPPQPIGVRALQVLEARIGQEEQPKGSNQGDIVRWACERWLSPTEFAGAYTNGIKWCAGAVCSAFAEAGSQEIKAVASLSCDTLWKRITHDRPDRKVKHGHEQPGDLYFWGSVGRLTHVGLVVEPGERLKTISGNNGDGVRYGRVRRDRVMWFCRLVA
jgi:cell wall-associated NlpC family hydrolase